MRLSLRPSESAPGCFGDKGKVNLRLCSRYRCLCEQYLDTAENTEQGASCKTDPVCAWGASGQVEASADCGLVGLIPGHPCPTTFAGAPCCGRLELSANLNLNLA